MIQPILLSSSQTKGDPKLRTLLNTISTPRSLYYTEVPRDQRNDMLPILPMAIVVVNFVIIFLIIFERMAKSLVTCLT